MVRLNIQFIMLYVLDVERITNNAKRNQVRSVVYINFLHCCSNRNVVVNHHRGVVIVYI